MEKKSLREKTRYVTEEKEVEKDVVTFWKFKKWKTGDANSDGISALYQRYYSFRFGHVNWKFSERTGIAIPIAMLAQRVQ